MSIIPLAADAGHSQDCRPDIAIGGLLNGLYIDATNGRLGIGQLQASCLPSPAGGHEEFPYHPYEGAKLTTQLRGPKGVGATYVWYANRVGSIWEMQRYKTVRGENPPLAPGDYTLEFATEGEPFFRFPFAVATRPNDDPYAPPHDVFVIEGPWNWLANLYYQRNDPNSSLSLTLWLRNQSFVPEPTPVEYEARIVRLADGAVVGTNAGHLRLAPNWQKVEVLFRSAGLEKSNRYLQAGELLSRDGDYRIELTIGGQQYGSYRVGVRKGAFVQALDPMQLARDPLTVLDNLVGGKYRSWWLRRE